MPTVLVADDNSNIQKMVALALEDQGISVVAVGNGEAAVRKLGEVQPDVVLADVFMPVRNGYEVCEFVKKDSRFAHIPVILLIGAFDPFDENEARRVGANGVLKKPFVPPEPLIAMVTGFIAGLQKQPAAAPVPTAQEGPTPRPLEALAFPEPVPAEKPEPESEPAEFAVERGPLSLRDEYRKAGEPAAPPAAELPSEEGWEERVANWRREAIGYEVPADVFEPSNELSASETARPASASEESPVVEEAIHAEPPEVSAGTSSDPGSARNSSEWMEMMSAPTHGNLAGPEPSFAPPPSVEVEGRRSIFHPERPAEQQPASETGETSSDSETVIPFRARTEAEAQPETFHEQAESEPHPETLPEEHPVEASSEASSFEPQPSPELFGYTPSSSYVAEATDTGAHAAFGAEEHSYAVPQEPEHAGSQVESYSTPQSLDPALVDAVVAKVLERIEPQLRTILTRELLRPLAESLLERELQKK